MRRDTRFLLRYVSITLVVILSVYCADNAGLFKGPNMYLYDLFFRIRGDRGVSKNIVIAAIDEKSLAELGKWPLKRSHYADLLDRLNEARIVGMDVIFAEPSDDDAVLADAAKRNGKVVMIDYIDRRLYLITPLPAFSPLATGHVHIESDVDGIVRKVFHSLYVKNVFVPSFTSVIYERASGRQLSRRTVPLGEGLITQADQSIINFYGKSPAFQEISVADIIDGNYPPHYFAGKIVLVGVTAAGIEEKFMTPFTETRSGSAGVEIHAHILDNLFDNNAIKEVPASIRRPLSLAYVLSFLVIFLIFNERASALLCLLGLSIVAAAAYALFSSSHLWLAPAVTLFLLVCMFVLSYLAKLDSAAARLDEAYVRVISHLGPGGEKLGLLTFRKGCWSGLSRGVINSRVELMTQVTDELTTRKEEAEQAKLRALETSKAKSEFLADMSHEFRTPLNSVLGFSELLQDELYGTLNEKQKLYVKDIAASGEHLLGLINDILEMARIEAGRLELKVSQFSLRDMLESSLSMFNENAVRHHLKLDLAIKEGADIDIEADERKVKQILFNLLGNAMKFTDEGGSIIVKAERLTREGLRLRSAECGPICKELREGDYVALTVEDTGLGIKPQDMDKLFKPFSQVESAHTKKFEGIGLGLALTRKLVELHGGAIWAESQFGKGSRFIFVIPTARELRA